ncbi:MAG TPA: sigma-54-dependent Fis family transcriptional regulator [bacterium]|nr:sigma-54-dependent Fis family transcriptional regulator [bacterium]
MDDQKTRSLKDVESLLGPSAAEDLPSAGAGIAPSRFRLFCDITRKISQMDALTPLLDQVLDAAILLTGAERGFLLLQEDGEQAAASAPIPGFSVAAARKFQGKSFEGEDFQVSLTAVRKVLESGTSLITDDAQMDPRFQEKKSVVAYGLKAILSAPLELSGKVIGALYLDHRYRMGLFSEEDVLLTEAFAAQSALAIQKARMMEALRASHGRLEAKVGEQERRIAELAESTKIPARGALRYGYDEIIGESTPMMKVLELLDHVTDTAIPVWIHGESGTGKELIARSLHDNSDRKNKPFVAENVSAIPETLLESELFGHKKGSFTHADRDRVGLIEQADGGTLFLDEVADMSLAMQAKLLRVLQEGEVRPIGSSKKVKVDVRLVTASNKDLARMVGDGRFRQDLFFRINGVTINLPPLRERKEDIPLLVTHLSKKIARQYKLPASSVADDALDRFFRYDWPGNVRELEATLRNLLLFAKDRPVTRALIEERPELFARFSAPTLLQSPDRTAVTATDDDPERAKILASLKRHGMDKKKTADDLGIALRTLYLRLEQMGLPTKKRLLIRMV